jgi:hypothetical protein
MHWHDTTSRIRQMLHTWFFWKLHRATLMHVVIPALDNYVHHSSSRVFLWDFPHKTTNLSRDYFSLRTYHRPGHKTSKLHWNSKNLSQLYQNSFKFNCKYVHKYFMKSTFINVANPTQYRCYRTRFLLRGDFSR